MIKNLLLPIFILLCLTTGFSQDKQDLRFYPTKMYQKGGYEIKWFNNYYTESFDNDFRQDFFASFLQVLIGSDKNINWGIDLKFRSAATTDDKSNKLLFLPFQNVSQSENSDKINFRRVGLSAIGPRIRYGVKSKLGSVSILHAVYFPTLKDGQGNGDYGFTDWEGLQFYNNLFFEKKLNGDSNFFLDLGLHYENLGSFSFNEQSGYAQILTPITAIYNYYPRYKVSLYGMLNITPRIGINDNGSKSNLQGGAFSQLGLGTKYLITPKIEAELLFTQFFNFGAQSLASTFNLGIRYFY